MVAAASQEAHRVQAVVTEAASRGLDPIRTDVLARLVVVVAAAQLAVDACAHVALRWLVLIAEAAGVRSVAAAEPD